MPFTSFPNTLGHLTSSTLNSVRETGLNIFSLGGNFILLEGNIVDITKCIDFMDVKLVELLSLL